MNRPIKFRAWDEEDGMRDWDYVRTNWTLGILNGDSRTTIMQFTGLLDKNGKEIYESDRIDYEGVAFRVEWREASFVLVSELSGEWIYLRPEQPLVVTGNLYESN